MYACKHALGGGRVFSYAQLASCAGHRYALVQLELLCLATIVLGLTRSISTRELSSGEASGWGCMCRRRRRGEGIRPECASSSFFKFKCVDQMPFFGKRFLY